MLSNILTSLSCGPISASRFQLCSVLTIIFGIMCFERLLLYWRYVSLSLFYAFALVKSHAACSDFRMWQPLSAALTQLWFARRLYQCQSCSLLAQRYDSFNLNFVTFWCEQLIDMGCGSWVWPCVFLLPFHVAMPSCHLWSIPRTHIPLRSLSN